VVERHAIAPGRGWCLARWDEPARPPVAAHAEPADIGPPGAERHMTSAVGPEALDRYRCADRAAQTGNAASYWWSTPSSVHIARIGGAFLAWSDGGETALPPSPYPWFVSFPRDEAG
jgi:hypothetical protein